MAMLVHSESIASEFFNCTLKTFQNLRPKLYEQGFPRPLDLGFATRPTWLRADVEAWFLARPRREPAALPVEESTPKGKRGRRRMLVAEK